MQHDATWREVKEWWFSFRSAGLMRTHEPPEVHFALRGMKNKKIGAGDKPTQSS
jgi:hypothetical protein